MPELKTAKDLQNRHEDLRERLLAKLRADAFAIHHDEIVRSPQTEMDYIERIDRAETALAAANERIAQRDRQIDAFNSGGFADADAMAEKYLDLRIENDKFKQALADIQEIADRETSAEHGLLEEIIQCSMDALAVPGARTSS